jgi:hypothetical protein
MPDPLIETWRRIIVGDEKSWVLFEHGTCVVLMKPEQDLAKQAIDLMKEYGPVIVGTPAGDFNVIALKDHPGWVVTSHHPDILTYVAPDEVNKAGLGSDDMMVGLIGRSKRAQDAEELDIVHIEDRRKLPN